MKVMMLHLSDIHLTDESNHIFNKIEEIVKPLKLIETAPSKIIVVTTGDITYSGTDRQYEVAYSFYNTLKASLANQFHVDPSLVFAAGNHDCNFKEHDSAVRKTLINTCNRTNINDLDSEIVDTIASVQEEFKKFIFSQTDSPTSVNSVHHYYKFAVEGPNLVINAFNTAWISQLHEKQGSLLMPLSMMNSNVSENERDIYISIFHHPYNWLEATNGKEFKDFIEHSSDIILTGHEHDPEYYSKESYKGTCTQYYEGGVLQEHKLLNICSYNMVLLDIDNDTQKVFQFNYEDGKFISEDLFKEWVPFRRNQALSKYKIKLNDKFKEKLHTTGVKFSHLHKQKLNIEDIFIYPKMKNIAEMHKTGQLYDNLVDSAYLIDGLCVNNKMLIIGGEQSGKTTLSNILYLDSYRKGYVPILLNGEEIKSHDRESFLKMVDRKFSEQYDSPNSFTSLDVSRLLIIIDDFEKIKFNIIGKNKILSHINTLFNYSILFGNDILKLEEISVENENGDGIGSYEAFRLMPLGRYARNEMINKWYRIGMEYIGDKDELAKKVIKAEKSINILLGKKYLPHNPVIVLSMLQAIDTSVPLNTMTGTFGYLYEVLITRALHDPNKPTLLDLKYTYLSNLAFYVYKNKLEKISDKQLMEFNVNYHSKYKVPVDLLELVNNLVDAEILEVTENTFYTIKYIYMYYFFVARYIRDHIHEDEIRKEIRVLYDNILDSENGNIIIFLTHLSKDPFIISEFVSAAKSIFKDKSPVTLSTDVEFLSKLYDKIPDAVLYESNYEENRKEDLKRQDEIDYKNEQEEYEQTSIDKASLVYQLNLGFRMVDILGQILKNFHGSLEGDAKYDITLECYQLGLRLLKVLFEIFEDSNNMILDVVSLIKNQNKDKEVDQALIEKKIKAAIFEFCSGMSLTFFKRLSSAVGTDMLVETYKEIVDKNPTNAVKFIDISVKLDSFIGFPLSEIDHLQGNIKNNIFPLHLLKQLLINHIYLFPVSRTVKQTVCAKLGIKIEALRLMEMNMRRVKSNWSLD